MLSIVAQLLVPGWQTVTLVVSMLRVRPGAVVTMIGWTFGVVDCGTVVLAPVLEVVLEVVLEAGLGAGLEAGLEAAGGAAATGALAVPGLLAGAAEPVWDEAAGVLLPPPPPQATRAAQARSRA